MNSSAANSIATSVPMSERKLPIIWLGSKHQNLLFVHHTLHVLSFTFICLSWFQLFWTPLVHSTSAVTPEIIICRISDLPLWLTDSVTDLCWYAESSAVTQLPDLRGIWLLVLVLAVCSVFSFVWPDYRKRADTSGCLCWRDAFDIVVTVVIASLSISVGSDMASIHDFLSPNIELHF